MGNSGKNIKMNERQTGYRKRSHSRIKLLLIAIMAVQVIFILNIREIKAELKEMQNILERIETLQYGKNEIPTTTGTEKRNQSEDYANSVGMEYVEKPVQRTFEETVERLEELGQTNSDIEKICRNLSFYPENMLLALANNPEMTDFVAGYVDSAREVTGGFTDMEQEQDFPLLLQWDPRWGYYLYGDSCIGVAGCGPTCLSMVMLYLTENEALTPDVIADYAMEKGYYVNGIGTAWALIDSFPTSYGIGVAEVRVTENAIKEELEKGKVIICAMGQGDFTVSGHFIVIYDYNENGFLVNDPNCVARSRKSWSFDKLEEQIKKIWVYGNL